MTGMIGHRSFWISAGIAFLACILLSAASADGQNAPVSTIGTVNSYASSAQASVITDGLDNIGSFSIKIQYDPSIAQAVTVTAGALPAGSLSVNLNNPGQVFASWYNSEGLTLPGPIEVLNITFVKTGTGISPLTWLDDGVSCSWYDGNGISLADTPSLTFYIPGSVAFLSPDAPHTLAPQAFSCAGSQVAVPVKVTSFNSIGMVQLRLIYDVQNLGYQSFQNVSGFPGLTVDGSQPGLITISATLMAGSPGFTLADSSVLVLLNFLHTGGTTTLAWDDSGAGCQYGGPPPEYHNLNDLPSSTYYINGSVSLSQLPASPGPVTGPAGGTTCEHADDVAFTVDPVPHANTYAWTLPPGAVITSGALTNSILVRMGGAGSWEVTVSGMNGCGAGPVSPVLPLLIGSAPALLSQPSSPPAVMAGAGVALFETTAAGDGLTYQWQEWAGSWSDVQDTGCYTGSATASLLVTNPTLAMNGLRYRCLVSGSCPPDTMTDGLAMLAVGPATGLDGDISGSNRPALSIFPNPVTRELVLNLWLPASGVITAMITDPAGRKVFSECFGEMKAGSCVRTIPVSAQPGLYLLTMRVECGSKIFYMREKFIKR